MLDQAAEVWSDYLLGRVAELGSFRQHLFVVQGASSAKRGVAYNINRHILRHIAADVVKGNHQHVVFVQLPRFFLVLPYLPPYSPDLNPIEQAFAKLKSLLRKVAARSVSELCRTIGECLDVFEPDECANFFRNSGYESKQP